MAVFCRKTMQYVYGKKHKNDWIFLWKYAKMITVILTKYTCDILLIK